MSQQTHSDRDEHSTPRVGESGRHDRLPFLVAIWRSVNVFLLLAGITSTSGCFQPEPIRQSQLEQGYIMILPGVENTAFSMSGIYHGLREGGIEQALDINQWGVRPFGTFRNLLPYARNRQQAAAIAREISDYQRRYPGRPVALIGYSGGGAIAVWTAEHLPPGVILDRVILMGAALSPSYDPAEAILHCRRGLVNFYSEHDRLMINWGTRTFGTMDRVRTVSAGAIGFRGENGELLERPGLIQIDWRPEWRVYGHLGGHAGWRMRDWAREVLAPMIAPTVDPIAEPSRIPISG